MPEKDITEKILEAYNDVFADIVNVLLFNGEEVIRPEELTDQAPVSAYKADGRIHGMERDVAKRWSRESIRIACIGIENQTSPDMDMPLRVMGYDGAEYRSELLANCSDRYPVVTLVLYFGYKNHWNAPLSLSECFHIPAPFRPYVNDYRINLFEVAYLPDETVRKFKSDFRIVADYFVQMRKNDDYKPGNDELQHISSVLDLLSVMSHDARFEETYNNSLNKGGIKTMSEWLDRTINDCVAKGRAEGRAEGHAEGRAEGALDMAKKVAFNLKASGHSFEEIADLISYDLDTVLTWFAQ